ncbi:hypothetical protein EU514_09560 [Pseudomonas fragi]|nr:hypothetical protein [Pseudomonas fragi]
MAVRQRAWSPRPTPPSYRPCTSAARPAESCALEQAEQAMPYVKGSEVIRIEEGEEIYADTGKTPSFIEAEQAVSRDLDINGPHSSSL